jgi:ribosomal protein L11 methyltransferase
VVVVPQAVEARGANAPHNGSAVRALAPDALAPASYDIVLSNILAQPLIVLAPLLASRTAPGGRLALAGLLASQAGEVAAAYAPWIPLRVARRIDDWVLLSGKRS